MFYQQGDVKIHPVGSIVNGEKVIFPESPKKLDHLTLAVGEATGHHHTITDGEAVLYEENGVLYLHVEKESTLTHQEHAPIVLPKGDYKIKIVKEYDHFLEESRNVAD